MNQGILRLEFYGGSATQHQLDLYDAGRAIEGLGRTVSILGHFLQTGAVISQAPYSKAIVNLKAPQAGSVVLEAIIAVAAPVIVAPVILYLNQVMQKWLPGGSEADKSRMENLRLQLAIQGQRMDGLQAAIAERDRNHEVAGELAKVNEFISRHQREHDVMRSITSNSFSDIFRPVERSAEYALMYGEGGGAYTGVVDRVAVDQIQTEIPDPNLVTVIATVDAFARNSKRGTAFSKNIGRGFRFHYGSMGKLGEQDDFSWSQYHQKPLLMSGRFYYLFDGSIKRLEVTAVQRILSSDIEEMLS